MVLLVCNLNDFNKFNAFDVTLVLEALIRVGKLTVVGKLTAAGSFLFSVKDAVFNNLSEGGNLDICWKFGGFCELSSFVTSAMSL